MATFCNAVANDLPYTVNDPSVELELLYIDDLVEEMIVGLLQGFAEQPRSLMIPEMPQGSFAKKLYSTYLSYLPGYTHNIINLSDSENLVTVMYCNEIFDPDRPDTFFEPV